MKTEWMVILMKIGRPAESSGMLIALEKINKIGALDDYPTMGQIRDLGGEPYTLKEFTSIFNKGSLDMEDYLIHIRKVQVQELDNQFDLHKLANSVTGYTKAWVKDQIPRMSPEWYEEFANKLHKRITEYRG